MSVKFIISYISYIYIYINMEVFLKMVVPKMHCFLQEHPNKINDFGVPPPHFWKPPSLVGRLRRLSARTP